MARSVQSIDTVNSRGTVLPVPRYAERSPVAVIDIGSNSIRLVIYEGAERAPLPVFNEKVLCGLGRDLERTGKLSDEGVSMALQALPRFIHLAESMGASRIDMLATAAVREAKNGDEFVENVKEVCGHDITILSGVEEARLSAMGLISGTPGADGIMGDLGGGSVELVSLNKGEIGDLSTLPLGPLRFGNKFISNPNKAKRGIDEAVDAIGWLGAGEDKTFYAIGGAWRSLARLHMIHTDYPLHIMHHYRLPYDKAMDFTQLVSKLSSDTLFKIHGLNRRRVETLPYAAILLNRLLLKIQPSDVVLSAYGLREGSLFDKLPEEKRGEDPLMDACRRYAIRHRVSAVDGDQLHDWLGPAFPEADETEQRLRHAACLITDIGRGEHPDYRPEHTLMRVLRFPFVGINHHDRAFLALSVASRYGQLSEDEGLMPTIVAVMEDRECLRARAIGMAIRLAYSLSGGVAALLNQFALRRLDDGLVLEVKEPDAAALLGDIVERRLASLAKILDCPFAMRRSGNDA